MSDTFRAGTVFSELGSALAFIAQRIEHLVSTQGVGSSNLSGSTTVSDCAEVDANKSWGTALLTMIETKMGFWRFVV